MWSPIENLEKFEEFYNVDKTKFSHMFQKFIGRISEPGTIFVYKDHAKPTDDNIENLSGAIRMASAGVETACTSKPARLSIKLSEERTAESSSITRIIKN